MVGFPCFTYLWACGVRALIVARLNSFVLVFLFATFHDSWLQSFSLSGQVQQKDFYRTFSF